MQDGNTVVAVSRYLSLMFIPLTVSTKWAIVGDSRSQDTEVSQNQLREIYGDDTPSISILSRFALLFAIAALVIVLGVASLF